MRTARPAPSRVSILDTMAASKLFGPFFAAPSWQAWRAFRAGLFGLPMAMATTKGVLLCI